MRPFLSRPMVLVTVAGTIFLGLLAAACGGDEGGGDTATRTGSPVGGGGSAVTVRLTNWKVEPSANEVPAGKVTFTAVHPKDDGGHGGHGATEAGAVHQLVVVPLEEGAKAGESRFGTPLLNLADIKLGESKSATVDLPPGRYELNCLVVEKMADKDVNHYSEGMYALLTVT